MRLLFWPKVAASAIGGALHDLRAAIRAWWITRRAFCLTGRGNWLTPTERQRLQVEEWTP